MMGRLLSGCRILIVEDDYYQAHDSQELLEKAGAQIVSVGATVPDIAGLLAQGHIDAALIDINLGQNMSFEFARALRDQAIPFVFLTGYDISVVPDDLAGAPYISKPAQAKQIIEKLAKIASRKEPMGDPG
jgi:CheY-like chemotaxis protein